jgi:hypothetical protein
MRLIKIKAVPINLTNQDEKTQVSLDVTLYVYFLHCSYLFLSDMISAVTSSVKMWRHDTKYFHFPVFCAIYERTSKVSIPKLFRCGFLSGYVYRVWI